MQQRYHRSNIVTGWGAGGSPASPCPRCCPSREGHVARWGFHDAGVWIARKETICARTRAIGGPKRGDEDAALAPFSGKGKHVFGSPTAPDDPGDVAYIAFRSQVSSCNRGNCVNGISPLISWE